MNWWCGDASWSVGGWWWLVPLIGMALCITLCMLFRSSMTGRHFCCWGGVPDNRLDEVRKEIRELKEEIGKMKKT
jgi:phosphate/sulfate permease